MRKLLHSLLVAFTTLGSVQFPSKVAYAACPVVEDAITQQFATQTQTHNVTMPATVNAGEILAILFNVNTDTALTTPTGWTLELGDEFGVDGSRFGIYWKSAAGTEGGTSVNVQSAASREAAVHVYRVSAASDFEVGGANNQEGGTSTPTPGSFSPSFAPADILWLAVSFTNDDGATASLYPTDYTNGITTASGGATNNSPSVHSARRCVNASSQDPATFTISESEAAYSVVVAFAPAAAGTSMILKRRREGY